MSDLGKMIADEFSSRTRTLDAIADHVAARLDQHRENLAGWSEGHWCERCSGRGELVMLMGDRRTCPDCNGSKILDVGLLVPTEPDPDERAAIRRELVAAVRELEQIEAVLRGES